jgi:uncharacterized membrane protein YkvA (DUF1232 family)
MMFGTGFLDDASILLYAINVVASSITQEIKYEARKQLHQIFEFDDSELDDSY